jgi:hypothetical protein
MPHFFAAFAIGPIIDARAYPAEWPEKPLTFRHVRAMIRASYAAFFAPLTCLQSITYHGRKCPADNIDYVELSGFDRAFFLTKTRYTGAYTAAAYGFRLRLPAIFRAISRLFHAKSRTKHATFAPAVALSEVA